MKMGANFLKKIINEKIKAFRPDVQATLKLFDQIFGYSIQVFFYTTFGKGTVVLIHYPERA